MAIGDDWSIDYYVERIYHNSGATIYTTRNLYTWLMDTFDELMQTDDQIPMTAQTPNAFTIKNGWFIDDESVKYLKEGSISTDDYTDEIRVQAHDDSTAFEPEDVGIKIVGGTTTDTGILLAYSSAKFWVRMDESGDTFDDDAETITMVPEDVGGMVSYDVDGSTFVNDTADANEATANDFDITSVNYEQEDAAYFGYRQPFNTLTINVGTAGAGYAYAWEYSTGGDNWSALTGITDDTNGCISAGTNSLTFTVPSDWDLDTVGTAGDAVYDLYWVRLRLTDGNGSQQALGTQAWITGTGSVNTAAISATGEDIFTNLYTLGAIESTPAPQIYIFQDGSRISEWSTLTNFNPGHIDVLIKIQEADVEIDDGIVTVFARQYGDLFDHFEVDLSAAGRQPAPLGTAADNLDNIKPEYYLLYDDEQATGPALYDKIIGGTSGAYAEVRSIIDWGGQGVLGLGNWDGTAFQDDEELEVSGSKVALANGTLGDCYLEWDNETNGGFAVGNTVDGASSGAQGICRGQQDDGAAGKCVIEFTASNYNDYDDTEDLEVAASDKADAVGDGVRAISAMDDISLSHMSHELDYDTGTADISEGDTVTGLSSGASGYVIVQTGSQAAGTLFIGNWNGTQWTDGEKIQVSAASKADVNGTMRTEVVFTKAHEQASSYPYNCQIDGAARYINDVYEYTKFYCRDGSSSDLYPQTPLVAVARYDDNASFTNYDDEAKDDTDDDVRVLRTDAITDQDFMYFGHTTAEFGGIMVNVTTPNTADTTIVWQYWNGSWTSLADVVDDCVSAYAWDQAGWNLVSWQWPSDWATTAINAVTAYWVRARYVVTAADNTDVGQVRLLTTEVAEDGEEYIQAHIPQVGYALKKTNPLGNFAGGKMYGARGIWIQNLHSDDVQNFSLTEASGTVQDPPNKQALTITNLLADDSVAVYRTSAGDIYKTQYTSHATSNNAGNSTFVIQEALAVDTPPGSDTAGEESGIVRIVDDTDSSEQRYRYSSWDTSTFTLETEITAACTGGGTSTLLQDDTTHDFTAVDIEVGDLVRNTTDGSFCYVEVITDADNITTTALTGGSDNTWTATDTFSFHTLARDYNGDDTLYVPFIERVASGTSEFVTCIYLSNRAVLIRVRRSVASAIIEFETTGTFQSTGLSVAAVRTPDTIVE